MVNIMSILHIWWIEIRSGRERADVENREVDLSRRRELNRGPRRNLGALPDRVARDEAIHTPKIEDQGLDRDRDRAVPSHRGPGVVLDLAVGENRQVDLFLKEGQDQIPGQSTRVALDRAADRS